MVRNPFFTLPSAPLSPAALDVESLKREREKALHQLGEAEDAGDLQLVAFLRRTVQDLQRELLKHEVEN